LIKLSEDEIVKIIKTFNQGFEYMLGEWLLVASVHEQGVSNRSLYLPSNRRNTSILSSSCRGCTLNLLYLGSQDLMLMSDEKQNVYQNQDFHLL
jgi:hypothetical protein